MSKRKAKPPASTEPPASKYLAAIYEGTLTAPWKNIGEPKTTKVAAPSFDDLDDRCQFTLTAVDNLIEGGLNRLKRAHSSPRRGTLLDQLYVDMEEAMEQARAGAESTSPVCLHMWQETVARHLDALFTEYTPSSDAIAEAVGPAFEENKYADEVDLDAVADLLNEADSLDVGRHSQELVHGLTPRAKEALMAALGVLV